MNQRVLGKSELIRALLESMGENAGEYEIVDCEGEIDASTKAMELVRVGAADIEMKGNLPSADFLLPIMNPFGGLVELGDAVSETTVFFYREPNGKHRLMFATDCALSVSPTFEDKIKLVNNAVELARAFGFDEVRVASIGALEKVNPEIPNTQDSLDLSRREWGEGIIAAGPFALDNALDVEAAAHKGIESPVAGKADVLLMHDLTVGNVFHKCLHYLGHLETAAVVCGTSKAVVFTSRSDSAETKYHSILSAIIQSIALSQN